MHTVGIQGGYTETDVWNSAYIMTGRTVNATGMFTYDARRHWTGKVKVLGFTHDNASTTDGLAVGDAYLTYLAKHPATARNIARKLAVRFVCDKPPQPLVDRLGPGTTFRGIALGTSLPRSLIGAGEKLVLRGINEFRLDYTGSSVRDKTLEAQPAVTYPSGGFAGQLREVARLIKAQVGLRVVAMNVGGWDMHTGLGRVDAGEMRNHLDQIAKALDAFATDLGPALDDVTLVTMSEFGRRVVENGNAGTDHGHGGVMLLLGGGLAGGKVHGRWPGLAESALDHGDLAGANDYRDVLGELLTARLGIGDLKKIFPGHTYRRLGVFS